MTGRARRRRLVPFTAGVLATAAVAAVALAGPGLAQSEQPTGLGVRAAGVADLVRIKQTPAVQGPTPPLVIQVGASDVIYDDENGQITAFSSTLYPSDLGQCPTCLLGALGFPVVQQLVGRDHPLQQLYFDALPALVPSYPLVTKASVPGDPGRKFNPIGDVTGFVPTQGLYLAGVTQDAQASTGFAAAETVGAEVTLASPLGQSGLQAAFAPVLAFAKPFVGDVDPIGGNLVRLEGARSRSSVVKGDDRAEVRTSARIARVQLLGGLVQLADVAGSIVQSVAADRPDDVRTLEQRIDVGPATIAGIGVVFEGDAVRVRDSRIPVGATAVVQSLLNQAMSQAGLELRLPGPATTGNRRTAGAFGVTFASGDRIDVDVLTLGSEVGAFVTAGGGEGGAAAGDVPAGGANGALSPDDVSAGIPTVGSETGMAVAPVASGPVGPTGAPEVGGGSRATPGAGSHPAAVGVAMTPVAASLQELYGRLFALGAIAGVLLVAVCRRRTGPWGGEVLR